MSTLPATHDAHEAQNAREDVDIQALMEFLGDFACKLLGVGSQPSRVIRSLRRIARTFSHGVEVVILPKHIILTVFDKNDHNRRRTAVWLITPGPFNFSLILKLNVLSWNAHDFLLPLATLRQRYEEIITEAPNPAWLVLLMATLASAAFCRLFGGDMASCGVVFCSTLVAFFLRQRMMALHMDHRMVFMTAAFAASMLAAQLLRLVPSQTPETALATSVLFLIPGVPLINAINDIIEGHVLMGIARAINTSILIVCIALGLSATLLIMGASVA